MSARQLSTCLINADEPIFICGNLFVAGRGSGIVGYFDRGWILCRQSSGECGEDRVQGRFVKLIVVYCHFSQKAVIRNVERRQIVMAAVYIGQSGGCAYVQRCKTKVRTRQLVQIRVAAHVESRHRGMPAFYKAQAGNCGKIESAETRI